MTPIKIHWEVRLNFNLRNFMLALQPWGDCLQLLVHGISTGSGIVHLRRTSAGYPRSDYHIRCLEGVPPFIILMQMFRITLHSGITRRFPW